MATPASPQPPKPEDANRISKPGTGKPDERKKEDEALDEALEESFPASDPPAVP
ncbi:MAG: hypothetical protein U1E38_00885 [Rhodospirillales bacterium]